MRYGVIILLASLVWSQNLCGQISDEELQLRKAAKMAGMFTSAEIDERGGGPPEQDCNSALPLCEGTFSQPIAYSGTGDLDEVPGSSCLEQGERNSVWYIFTVQTSGTLEFTIDPVVDSDDYDFALYDLTGRNCSDIATGVAPEVRCNYCVDPGNTGISASGMNPSEPCCDYDGCQFSSILNVTAGETYALTVSNFTSSNSGYELSIGGTAEVSDESAPEPSFVVTPCGVNFITVDMSEPILCESLTTDGSQFTLTGPGGPFTISGADGLNCGSATAQVTLDIAPPVIIGETYTLTVNQGTGNTNIIDNCDNEAIPGTSLEFVAVPNAAEIEGPTNVCAGSSAVLTASDGLMFNWSNGDTTQSISVSPLENTTYDVTVTSGTCVQSASHTVTVRPSPLADFSFSPATPCEGESVTFSNTSTFLMSCFGLGITPCTDASQCGGLPCLDNITFTTYDFDDGSTSSLPNPSHTFGSAGTYNVSLTVNDEAANCSNEIIIPVEVLPGGGDLTLTGSTETCAGEPVELMVSGGTSYNWTSDPPGFTSTDETIIVSPTTTTTYTVTAPGCSGDLEEAITVIVNDLPSVSILAGSQSICVGTSTTLTANGADDYIWSPSTGLNTTTGAVVQASPTTTTTYTVTGTDENGCENTSTIEVTVVDGISTEITADGPLTICEDVKGIDINLDAGAGFTSYMWNTGSTDQVINVNSEGEYIVIVMDASGCIGTDTVNVMVIQEVDANAGDDTEICLGAEVMLSATGGDSYSWSPTNGLSNPNIANPVADPTVTTTYVVTVTLGECQGESDVEVSVLPLPIVEAGSDVTITAGQSVELSASGGLVYSWSPATGLSDPNIENPIASPGQTTTYTVTITDDNGCSSVDAVTVNVDDRECPLTTLYVPNAFSPNGDGHNDVLYVRLQDEYDRLTFMVYNRWGELVFETDTINDGWDGMYEGKIQTSGVFAYYLEIQCGDEIRQEKGNVTIVR